MVGPAPHTAMLRLCRFSVQKSGVGTDAVDRLDEMSNILRALWPAWRAVGLGILLAGHRRGHLRAQQDHGGISSEPVRFDPGRGTPCCSAGHRNFAEILCEGARCQLRDGAPPG